MGQITKKRPFSLHDQLFGDKQLLAESLQGFFWLGEKKRTEYSVIVKRCMKINGAGEWTSTRQGAAGLIQTLRCARRSSDVFGFMPQVSLTCGLNICKPNLSRFLKTLYDCFCTISLFFFGLFNISCFNSSQHIFKSMWSALDTWASIYIMIKTLMRVVN